MSTKTKKIVWRLGKLPSPDEVALLLDKGVLTKDEAREILFSLDTVEERDEKSLKDEIKFLRELVSKLSNNSRTEIVKQIEYIHVPYRKYDWYAPYQIYCTAGATPTAYTSSNSQLLMSANTANSLNNSVAVSYSAAPDFTAIKTF